MERKKRLREQATKEQLASLAKQIELKQTAREREIEEQKKLV